MTKPFTRRQLLALTASTGAIALAGCTTTPDTGPNNGSGSTGSPTPDDQPADTIVSFDVAEGECGGVDGDVAAVSVEGDIVTIVGEVPTPNPCYTLNLGYTEPTTANPPQARLDVVRTDEEVCIECTGVVTYELVLRFEQDTLPEQVTVTHARGESETEFELTL